MTCQDCGRPATVVFQSIVQNQVAERRLCSSCADAASPFSVTEFLLGAPRRTASSGRAARCAACGCAYAEFQRSNLLGCPDCYKSFERAMETLIPRLHGAPRHRGAKAP